MHCCRNKDKTVRSEIGQKNHLSHQKRCLTATGGRGREGRGVRTGWVCLWAWAMQQYCTFFLEIKKWQHWPYVNSHDCWDAWVFFSRSVLMHAEDAAVELGGGQSGRAAQPSHNANATGVLLGSDWWEGPLSYIAILKVLKGWRRNILIDVTAANKCLLF